MILIAAFLFLSLESIDIKFLIVENVQNSFTIIKLYLFVIKMY